MIASQLWAQEHSEVGALGLVCPAVSLLSFPGAALGGSPQPLGGADGLGA